VRALEHTMETSKKTLNDKCRLRKFLNDGADTLLTVAARASAHSGDRLEIYLSLVKRDKSIVHFSSHGSFLSSIIFSL
jgi:hypothetical protein